MKDDTICGLAAVHALFARRPDAVKRLFYTARLRHAVGGFCATLAATRRPYRMVEDDDLEKIAGTPHHAGIAAVARPRIPHILSAEHQPADKLLLVLDGIGNPHNLGAIARCAAFFGVQSLLIGEAPGNAMPSDAAYRTSEGGLEYLDLYRTRDLVAGLTLLASAYRPVAATLTADALPPAEVPRDRPLALILGSEETGISAPVLNYVRRRVRIPGRPEINSLNVAQAAAVLLFALQEG